jgi:hypothetical protein
MNHAVQLMARHPALKYGGIFEIRPAADMNEVMRPASSDRAVHASLQLLSNPCAYSEMIRIVVSHV